MVAMTRSMWVDRALGRGFASYFGAIPNTPKEPTIGAVPPLDLAQVTTREVVQQIATELRDHATTAEAAAVRALDSASGLPDADAWRQRVHGQLAAALTYAGQAIRTSSAIKINWTFAKSQLASARDSTNLVLATGEQIQAAIDTWHSEQTRLTGQVVVYEHDNYQGRYQSLAPGEYNTGQLTIGNDVISSIKVPPGYVVTLFEHRDFGGRSSEIRSNTPSLRVLGAWNDTISSIKVETQAMAAQRSQLDAERARAAAQAEAQQAQIEQARQAAELQIALAQQAAHAGDAAALARAQAQLEQARAEMDAWSSAHPTGGGGGGGAPEVPTPAPAIAPDGSAASAPTSPLLYVALGLGALWLLKGSSSS